MNDRIEDFAEALEAVQADAPVGEGAPRADETHRFDVSVAAIAQQEVGVVGRICADGDGRLSEGSIALEGSTGRSRGASVALDLSRVPAFSVFPGQVVAVRGLNPTGRAFLAQSIATAYPDGARPGRCVARARVESPQRRRRRSTPTLSRRAAGRGRAPGVCVALRPTCPRAPCGWWLLPAHSRRPPTRTPRA